MVSTVIAIVQCLLYIGTTSHHVLHPRGCYVHSMLTTLRHTSSVRSKCAYYTANIQVSTSITNLPCKVTYDLVNGTAVTWLPCDAQITVLLMGRGCMLCILAHLVALSSCLYCKIEALTLAETLLLSCDPYVHGLSSVCNSSQNCP